LLAKGVENIVDADKRLNEKVESTFSKEEQTGGSNIDLDLLESFSGGGAGSTGSEAKLRDSGLSTSHINKYMEDTKGFVGTFPRDMLVKVPASDSPFGFVMNLDPSTKKGSHWVAVFIDPQNSIEYYDSFGKHATKTIIKGLKGIVDKLNPSTLLKFNENKIVEQRANTNYCGYFAMKFIKDRLKGKPFKEASGFSTVLESEADLKKWKRKLRPFEYFKSGN